VAIVFSVLLWFTDSDYSFGILWPLCCLFYFDKHNGQMKMGETDNTMATGYQRDNQNPWIKVEQTTQWPQDTKGIIRIRLCCLFYFDSGILIIPLVSCGHCVVCSTLIHGFWLSLWYLVAIVLSVLLWYQNPWIKVEQKTQWPQATKGIIRIRESK
jgi:hypothetical protein